MWTRWVTVGIVGLAFASLIGWRITDRKKLEAELMKDSGPKSGKKAPTVESTLAGPAEFTDQLEVPISLVAPSRQLVSPVTTGRIEAILVQEGDRVRAGQVLVRLDPSDADSQIASAQAAIAEAKARLAQAQLTSEATDVGVSARVEEQQAATASASASYRQTTENRVSQIASAQAQVEDAASQVKASEAQVRNAEAVVDREKANLRNAETRLSRTKQLYSEGFIAAQDLDDAQTAKEVQSNTVRVAEAALQQVRESVKSAQARLQVAQNNLVIARRRTAADVEVAQAQRQQTQAQLRSAKANQSQTPAYRANLDALRQAVKAGEARLTQAQAARANTELRAAMDGVVITRSADPGSLASPSSPILIVEPAQFLDAVAAIPIEIAGRVPLGIAGTVRLEGFSEREFPAIVRQLNPSADGQSRQVTLRAKVPNASGGLRSGMFGKLLVTLGNRTAPVSVPRTAVRDTEGVQLVRVIGEGGTVEVRPVEIGSQDEWKVEVKSGLKAGEKVVVMSYQSLRDGQKVKE